jgi:hypothetical protein
MYNLLVENKRHCVYQIRNHRKAVVKLGRENLERSSLSHASILAAQYHWHPVYTRKHDAVYIWISTQHTLISRSVK